MSADALDFDAEIRQLCDEDPLVGQGEVTIWGGRIGLDDLSRFLQAWPLERMPYRIWEDPDRMVFQRDKMPEDDPVIRLDRGRMFGCGGDLSLRRDGGHYRWHFVGPPQTPKPSGFCVSDFWTKSPEGRADAQLKLRQHTESALLWGEYDPKLRDENESNSKYWHDDRVGWATLKYPIDTEARVQIQYTVYTNQGQVGFVWLRGLSDYA